MKEIMAFIRTQKVNDTRKALELNGFYAYTCRKCLGHGKERLSSAGESLVQALEGETRRLIAKRYFTLIVDDEDVKRAVNIIIEANRTGNPGDGKIFVRSLDESYCVRTGESNKLDS